VPKLSAVIITRNEAADIERALRSVAWADEKVVVDAMSTDATRDIAAALADRIVTREWPGFSAQKNFGASIAANDWILSIDADEDVSSELARGIQAVLQREPECRAYRVSRVTWHLGRWVRSTDWYPDDQLRLYDRRASRWTGDYVHEALAVEGPIGRIPGELRHYPYRDLDDHLDTINRYTTLAAEQMIANGRRVGLGQLVLHPLFAFVRNYLLRGGVRDGTAGFIISVMNAYYVFLKFAKAWTWADRRNADKQPAKTQV
jgi:glycosyltransferase involved in cell wall biosynthesis